MIWGLMKIRLEITGEVKNSFLYRKLAIFDCTCLLENGKLCATCSNSSYSMSSPGRMFQNRLFVYVTYAPQILEDLSPNVHFFAGVFNINKDKSRKEMKSIYFFEEVEPPGYSWNGQEIGFDAGGFQREDILCPKSTEMEDGPKNYMLEKNSVCQNCADKGIFVM